jgi:hypothetical protein
VSASFDRALADLVGGWDGGATLWELACARLARLAREYADEPMRFKSHPAGMLRRLEVACEDALRTVEVAVDLHLALDDELPSEERAAQLVDLLVERARRLAAERQGVPLGAPEVAAGAPAASSRPSSVIAAASAP